MFFASHVLIVVSSAMSHHMPPSLKKNVVAPCTWHLDPGVHLFRVLLTIRHQARHIPVMTINKIIFCLWRRGWHTLGASCWRTTFFGQHVGPFNVANVSGPYTAFQPKIALSIPLRNAREHGLDVMYALMGRG